MPMTTIKSLDDFHHLINGNTPVIIDCYADWCGPCRMIGPVIGSLAEQIPEVTFAIVNVDEADDVSQEIGVKAMPTIVGYKNGIKHGEVVGANVSAIQDLVVKMKSL